MAIVSAHQGCFIRDVLEHTLQQAQKSHYLKYVTNHLASQAKAISAGFVVGILDERWLRKYPDLVVLTEEQGFPALPTFHYECIGEADTADKHNVKEALHLVVNQLNGEV